MKSLVLVITLITVAGSARATEMVEVPNPPPYLPPREPTPLEKRHDAAAGMLGGGLVLLVAGLGIDGAAVGFAVDHPCALPLSCLFGPPNDDFAGFVGLAFSGLLATGGGIALTAIGGSRLRRPRRPLKVSFTGTGLSLSGRF